MDLRETPEYFADQLDGVFTFSALVEFVVLSRASSTGNPVRLEGRPPTRPRAPKRTSRATAHSFRSRLDVNDSSSQVDSSLTVHSVPLSAVTP